MSILRLTLYPVIVSFVVLMTVLSAAAAIHSLINKKRIKKNFHILSSKIAGKSSQVHLLSYPRFDGELKGRRASVFFHRGSPPSSPLTCLIYLLSVQSHFRLLLLQEGFYKPVSDKGALLTQVGEVVPALDSRYQVRSTDEAAARKFFQTGDVRDSLSSLTDFPSLFVGPDSMIASMPFDDLSTTSPDRVFQNIVSLEKVAASLESMTGSAQ